MGMIGYFAEIDSEKINQLLGKVRISGEILLG